ncbi:MAG: cytochrome C [Planctomycetota bacterium]
MRATKLVTAFLATGLLFCLTASLTTQAGNGIKGSAHDFSIKVWNFRKEICRVCHVPHDHDRTFKRGLAGLLWNHAFSSATYTMYQSETLDGAQDTQPTGIAKMCLGCHDGTVALDAFDKNPVNTGGPKLTGGFRIPGLNYWNTGQTIGDLRATHPLSIIYDETKDKGLAPKTTAMGTSGPISKVLEGGTKLQCHSCHDVHDEKGEAVPNTHLLRVAQSTAQGGTASGLCLTCHIK